MSAGSSGTNVVIFDIDGTLTDSIGRVVSTLKRCGTSFGAPEPDDALCRSAIGLSLKLAVARCYPESSDDEVSRFTDEYRRIYNEEDRTKPAQLFDGIESMLSELQKAGFALALASGKSRRGVNEVIRNSRLDRFVSFSSAGDEYPSKPAPDMLEAVADHFGADPTRCLMVGDSVLDIAMGINADMRTLGVSWGAESRKKLLTAEPDEVLDSPYDMTPEFVSGLFE